MKSACNLIMMAVFVLSLGLSGCVEEDPAKPLEVDWSRTATLKGKILINEDISTGKPQRWTSPNITNQYFVVTMDYSELITTATGVYFLPNEKIDYNRNTGVFIITVPVGIYPMDISVHMTNFDGQLIKDRVGVSDETETFNIIWQASKLNGKAEGVRVGDNFSFGTWTLDGNNASDYAEYKNVNDKVIP